MEFVLASRNKNKIRELREMLTLSGLKDFDLLSLDDIGVDFDIEENGRSFEENSLIKANVPASRGYVGIADDSGLCVDALDGEPGIYSARYSGENADYKSNNAKLLKKLGDRPTSDRGARFVCVISCVIPASSSLCVPSELDMSVRYAGIVGNSKAFCVRGECSGVILDFPRGDNGFGYDPLFYFPEKNKTFAELSEEEKNSVSHRGNAIRRFAQVMNVIMRGQKC